MGHKFPFFIDFPRNAFFDQEPSSGHAQRQCLQPPSSPFSPLCGGDARQERAKKGSTAVAKSHDLSKGYPVFKIETADGRLLEGSDAELWEYRAVIDDYRLQQNPLNQKSRRLLKKGSSMSPLWNSWISENEVKNAKDVFKKRHALSNKRSKTANHPTPPSSPVAHYIIEMDGALTETGKMCRFHFWEKRRRTSEDYTESLTAKLKMHQIRRHNVPAMGSWRTVETTTYSKSEKAHLLERRRKIHNCVQGDVRAANKPHSYILRDYACGCLLVFHIL
ncbi:hypothetical protein L5515_015685 [Caenorhabditis briggsae]|uniref:Uncharacterized protein n=1 Tax=Caenorhabditis briggsae TaxID=6238 RepID=A0AAE9EFA9_CAEBR|nr:hypothetical protein L5515_015685 [Caenorhabditis briggsae]